MPVWCGEDGHEIFRGSVSEMATALDEARKEIERLKREVFDRECKNDAWAMEVDKLKADNDRLYAAIREILASPPAGVSNAVVSEMEREP